MEKMEIVAIGGGEIGRPGYSVETTKIDKEIIRLTGKKKPKLLFIPTASSDSAGYYDVVKKHFGKQLGCRVDVLYLIKGNLSKSEVERKIMNTDIVYVGGGNTLKMMKVWREYDLDRVMQKAADKGVVLSGVSAGAICWFRYGNSDARRFSNPDADLIKVRGLNFVNALYCPHYHTEKDRISDLKKMMKTTSGIALAVDNCAALEIVNDNYRILASKPNANAYKVYWKNGKYVREKIEKRNEFSPLEDLLKK